MPRIKQLLKFALVGGAISGTILSLRANNYDLNSIGIVRLNRAAITVLKISATYRKHLYKNNLDKNSEEYRKLVSDCHQKGANKLLELCCINKGVYIKVGQHIAALDYLVPKEYVQTMKILHSHAPQNKIEDVYKVIKEDLKRDPTEIFESIDPEPTGAASLAQVHKAVLKDGTIVAVKVQHSYVKGNALVDLKTMEALVKLVSLVFPEFQFQWLVDETKKNIPKELDFEQEGHNAEKAAKMFEKFPWLKVPKVHWDLSSPRVITMDFIEGGQVNDLKYIQENKINPYEVSDKLGLLYANMIFINGFVHSDPHPGNILLKTTKNGECDIILLDHGLYATLTKKVQVEYAQLWLSILDRNRVAMRLHSQNLGIEGDLYGLFACMVTGRTWDSILDGIDKHKPSKREKKIFQQQFPNFIPQISGILQHVDRQLLLILKTNDLIRGIEHTLQTNARMGAFKVMLQCCVRSVYKQKIDSANGAVHKFKITMVQYWILCKISIYYTFINLKNALNDAIFWKTNSLEVIKN